MIYNISGGHNQSYDMSNSDNVNSKYKYTTDSQYFESSMPLAKPEIIPLVKKNLYNNLNSIFNQDIGENNHVSANLTCSFGEMNGEDDENNASNCDLVVASTQAIDNVISNIIDTNAFEMKEISSKNSRQVTFYDGHNMKPSLNLKEGLIDCDEVKSKMILNVDMISSHEYTDSAEYDSNFIVCDTQTVEESIKNIKHVTTHRDESKAETNSSFINDSEGRFNYSKETSDDDIDISNEFIVTSTQGVEDCVTKIQSYSQKLHKDGGMITSSSQKSILLGCPSRDVSQMDFCVVTSQEINKTLISNSNEFANDVNSANDEGDTYHLNHNDGETSQIGYFDDGTYDTIIPTQILPSPRQSIDNRERFSINDETFCDLRCDDNVSQVSTLIGDDDSIMPLDSSNVQENVKKSKSLNIDANHLSTELPMDLIENMKLDELDLDELEEQILKEREELDRKLKLVRLSKSKKMKSKSFSVSSFSEIIPSPNLRKCPDISGIFSQNTSNALSALLTLNDSRLEGSFSHSKEIADNCENELELEPFDFSSRNGKQLHSDKPSSHSTKSPNRRFFTSLGIPPIPPPAVTDIDVNKKKSLLKRKFGNAQQSTSTKASTAISVDNTEEHPFNNERNVSEISTLASASKELEMRASTECSSPILNGISDEIKSCQVNFDEECEWTSQMTFSKYGNHEEVPENGGITNITTFEDENFECVKSQVNLNEYDIPKSWTFDCIEDMKFSVIWSILRRAGWNYKRGTGLATYFYLRPGKHYLPPYEVNFDYFVSEDDIVKYLKSWCTSGNPALCYSSGDILSSAESSRKRTRVSSSNFNGLQLSSSTCSASPTKPLPSCKKTMDQSSKRKLSEDLVNQTTTVYCEQKGKKPKTGSKNSKIEDSAKEISNESPRKTESWRDQNLDSIPWPELWSLLKEDGWSYDHGSGLIDRWYLLPGYKLTNAICGIHSFSTEKAVIQYLKHKQTSNNNNSKSPIIECDSQAYIWDTEKSKELNNWNLVEDRKRRPLNKKIDREEDTYDYRIEDTGENTFAINHDLEDSEYFQETSAVNNTELRVNSKRLTKENQIYIQNESSTSKIAEKAIRDKTSKERDRNIKSAESCQKEHSISSESSSNNQTSSRRRPGQPAHISKNTPSSHEGKQHSKATPTSKSKRLLSSLLEGIHFIITGFPPDEREKIESLIILHNGTIAQEIPMSSYFQRNQDSTSHLYIFIGHPLGYRRSKHLLALIYGCPIVHELWVKRSVELNKREPFDNYILPSGSSSLYTYSVFPSGNKLTNRSLFKGIKFLNLADSSFKNVIESASGNVIEAKNEILKDIECFRRLDKWVQYIIVDSYAYRDILLKVSNKEIELEELSLTLKRKDRESFIKESLSIDSYHPFTKESFKAIQTCLRRNNVLTDNIKIHIVSLEWLANCIALSRVLSPMDYEVFRMPTQISKPYVYKVGIQNERYVIDDIVRYHSNEIKSNAIKSNSSKVAKKKITNESIHDNYKLQDILCYGRIIQFYEDDNVMKVKLIKLDIVATNFENIDCNNISLEIINKYNQMFSTPTSLQQKKHKINQAVRGSQMKALQVNRMDDDLFNDDRYANISADCLLSKVILLERKSYLALEYAWSDPNIYCMSAEWEEQEEDDGSILSPSNKYQRLASQDY